MAAVGALVSVVPAVRAAQPILEEIVVTGSRVPQTQETGALPVDVIDRDRLEAEGNPSFVELVRNLSYTGANHGETNQFVDADAAGVHSINLRSLGSYRTLVLLNSRRHAAFRGTGADLAMLPQLALRRLEILKDGAAAIYGSDAMGGVVNLLTRDGFRGLEVRAAHQLVEDGGDSEAGILLGAGGERWDWVTSAEFRHREPVRVVDRGWALPEFSDNPAGGFSIIAHPSRYLPATELPALGPTPLGPGGPDPQCARLGEPVTGLDCQFRYVVFDNLVEEENNVKVFTEWNADPSDRLSLHVEALYGWLEQPDIATSPSYPPRSLFGPDRYVPASHPGLQDMKRQHPQLFEPLFGIPPAAQGAFVLGRAEGVTGQHGAPGELGARSESFRLAGSATGTVLGGLDYDLGLSWSRYSRERRVFDTNVERMAFARDGLGGPGCDPARGVPGEGGCRYYNPFSNAIERSVINGAANPQFNPAVANERELLDWLRGEWSFGSDSDLLVADGSLTGESAWQLPGGFVGWAVGVQYRRERLKRWVDDVADLALNPCPFTDPTSIVLGHTDSLDCGEPTGLFGFTAGDRESDVHRSAYAAFAELSLPVTDALDVQLAVRGEWFDGGLGSSVDPKLAFRWQLQGGLALRGSVSTTFRAPFLNMLEGRSTGLIFVPQTVRWKALVTLGNPELKAEQALASNVGLLLERGAFTAAIDYWRFDIEDVIAPEPPTLVLDAYIEQGCFDGGAGADSAVCAGLRDNVLPTGAGPATLDHVRVSWANVVDTRHDGVDLALGYARPLAGGRLSVGFDGTYQRSWAPTRDLRELDAVTLVPEGDGRVGLLNDDVGVPPLPRIKANVRAGFATGDHAIQYRLNYVHDLRDETPPVPALAHVDEHVTHDLHYHWQASRRTRLSLSIINLLDEDPPRAGMALSYDPFTYNPMGRMVKLGLSARFGAD